MKTQLQRWFVLFVAFALVLGLAGVRPAAAQGAAQSYIVQAASAEQAAALVSQHGGRVTSALPVVNGVAAELSQAAAAALGSTAGVVAVTPNSAVEAVGAGDDEGGLGKKSPATDYPDVTGADLVWQQGDLGGGVAVAVLDTGIGKHKGLTKDVNQKNHRIVGWVDFIGSLKKPDDPNGHGTHIAGIIANSQVGSDKEWNGVAPGVNLVGVRVLDQEGRGSYETVIRGIQWVLENKDALNIRIINLSLVAPAQSAYWADPLNQAVTRAWAEGITVVAAAGNRGPGPLSIGVPGNNPYVITVGAFTDAFTPNDWNDDYLADFSAAGPTLDGFVKPDVVAPGAHMVSTMLPKSALAQTHQANQTTNQYFSMAGTSQSAAVVSGLSALILSHNPDLSPDQVKFRLLVTAFPWVDPESGRAGYSVWQQGAGRVNAPDAVFAEIDGAANAGLDIQADLAGATHYEGFSYWDETTGTFRLRGDYSAWDGSYGTWAGGYGTWAGGYGTWAGGYGTWAGGYGTWAGGYGTWAGGYGTWAGGYGTWAGGYGTWAGGYGTWAGGYGTWAGGYGTWAGGYGTWAGMVPWSNTVYAEMAFVEDYLAGAAPDASTTVTSINDWVDEP